MNRIVSGIILVVGLTGCSGEKVCKSCQDHDVALAGIVHDLLKSHQACASDEDCSLKEFKLTCENGSFFANCPVAVAPSDIEAVQSSWEEHGKSSCDEMRDCGEKCFATPSCIGPPEVKCVAGRCTAMPLL